MSDPHRNRTRPALALAACCAVLMTGPVPAPSSAQTSRPSATECDRYARNYAENNSRRGQVLGSGARGSLLGAGIGAIAGDAGIGAAVGGGLGLIAGGSRRRATADRMYDVAFQDCMAGRR